MSDTNTDGQKAVESEIVNLCVKSGICSVSVWKGQIVCFKHFMHLSSQLCKHGKSAENAEKQ